jgi:long-chain acyl-CoA synthetase
MPNAEFGMRSDGASRQGVADTDVLRRTLPGHLLLRARRHPEQVALREKWLGIWREITWAEYLRSVEAAAHMLRELGVRPGDHVAILSDNRPEWFYADMAAQAIGARSVGIYQTSPAPDVAYILNHSRSSVLVCEDQEQVDKAMEVAAETPHLRHVVVIEPRGTHGYADPRLVTWQRFLEEGEALRQARPGWLEQRVAELDPDAPAMVVYTSGTTGQPKGAMLSHTNVLAQMPVAEMLGVGEHDSVLSYLPLCHVAEKFFSLFQQLASGCVVHFGESIETVQQDLREVSPTVFLGVPRIWEKMHASVTVKMRDASWLKRTLFDVWTRTGQRIAERREAGTERPGDRVLWRVGDLLVFRPLQERLGLRRCRHPTSGAAPIAPELIRWFHAIGVPLREGYGQTETSCVSHISTPDACRIGSVGRPIPGTECRLAPDGEVLVRGPHVFLGYLHDPETTAATLTPDGWLRTGDTGDIDADGFLTLTGRKKEILITSGGKNISPEKIENALKLSPYVREAVAIGDGRAFVSALIQLDADHAEDWATRHKLSFTSYEDLTRNPEVRTLVGEAVRQANELLSQVEQVKSFRLLPRELTQDDGELTPTRKVRRRQVHAAFDALIEEMYGR